MGEPAPFLDLEPQYSDFERARVAILPLPYEQTVSYGTGTGTGPPAIIEASSQLELYDPEFAAEPALEYGIHTLPPLGLPESPKKAVEVIAEAVRKIADHGRLVVALGGEHTVSIGVCRGLLRAIRRPISVVQIDAHADLRDRFEGTSYNHACVARRLLEEDGVEQIIQFGVRSLCREEADFIADNRERIRVVSSEEARETTWRMDLPQRLHGKNIFLTIDVDGLDPSVIAGTGTPEPGGLNWQDTLAFVRQVAGCGTIVGLDCVELAPIPGQHGSQYAAAKLLYKAISYALGFRANS